MNRKNALILTLNKMWITLSNIRRTAYHHYGKSPLSFIKLFYYSGIRINTFYVYEKELTEELIGIDLDPCYRVMKPSIEELARIREGKDLPREFYYDKIFNAKRCYLVCKENNLALIYWVLFKGDYSRFLILGDGIAELNYQTTLPNYRGNHLMEKMTSYIANDLKKEGYLKLMAVPYELNYPSIKCFERTGFKRRANIKTLGPLNRKLKIS